VSMGGQRRTAGFSLIEILVVITIIGILMTLGFGPVQNALESGKVTKCRAHLQNIGKSMLAFREQRNKGHWPKESGARFLLKLHQTKELSGRNSEAFLCPGTPDVNDTGPDGEPGSSYADWENIDSSTISYAGRDQEGSPIKGNDLSAIIIAADDNEGRPNHTSVTNYVYADGSTDSFDLQIDGSDLLVENPALEQEGLPVGPDCPYEPLRVLRAD
jgi:prepilin-type N-terminal cleavage/methylation domain-containing protein